MDKLDSYLLGYPAFLQKPLFAIILIVFGYFIAKIAAVILSKLFHIQLPQAEEAPTQGVYFMRLLFWGVWLAFIIAGLVKFPTVRDVFSNIYLTEENIWAYFAILIGAGILSLLSAPLKSLLGESLKLFSRKHYFKNGLFVKILAWCVFWVGLVAAGVSMDAPDTVYEMIMATLLLLAMGWIVGAIVKEAVFNLLSIFDFTYSSKDIDLSLSINLIGWYRVKKLSAPKHIYFGNIAFMLFGFAAVRLWV